MFRVFSCLAGEHDWRLAVLAGVVCFLASLVAINIFHRAVVSPARTRSIWIAIAGGAIGYGIWATHFIAMLAYDPGVSTGYGIALTALSLVVAMVLTSSGFGLAASGIGHYGAPIGGGIIGAGIASMHYLGMWALEVPGRVTWSGDLVFASIVLAMLLGIAALAVAVQFSDRRGTIVAALLLTLAIVSHHFTANDDGRDYSDEIHAKQMSAIANAFLGTRSAQTSSSIVICGIWSAETSTTRREQQPQQHDCNDSNADVFAFHRPVRIRTAV